MYTGIEDVCTNDKVIIYFSTGWDMHRDLDVRTLNLRSGVSATFLLHDKCNLLFSYCVLDLSCAVWLHALLLVFLL